MAAGAGGECIGPEATCSQSKLREMATAARQSGMHKPPRQQGNYRFPPGLQ
ncbi:MAG: hypothetical protein QOF56_1496, partial [Acidobacteriaceae bacterium]|nr:hypothetical protein [Acidobacteriaceae bacterium]